MIKYAQSLFYKVDLYEAVGASFIATKTGTNFCRDLTVFGICDLYQVYLNIQRQLVFKKDLEYSKSHYSKENAVSSEICNGYAMDRFRQNQIKEEDKCHQKEVQEEMEYRNRIRQLKCTKAIMKENIDDPPYKEIEQKITLLQEKKILSHDSRFIIIGKRKNITQKKLEIGNIMGDDSNSIMNDKVSTDREVTAIQKVNSDNEEKKTATSSAPNYIRLTNFSYEAEDKRCPLTSMHVMFLKHSLLSSSFLPYLFFVVLRILKG